MKGISTDQPVNPDDSRVIGAAVVMAVIGPIFFLLQPFYVGALADVVGFNAQQIGWLIGAEISGTAVASIAAFFYVRYLNWRAVVTFALLAQAICNLASCLVTGYTELLLLRFVTAVLGMGPLYIIAIAMLSVTTRTGVNFSIVVFGQMTLAIAGLAILPDFVQQFGMAALFAPIAIIGVVAFSITGFIPRQAMTRAEGRVPEIARNNARPAIGVLWVQSLWYLGIAGVWTFIERIGVEAGLASTDVNTALAIGMAVGLAGAISSGYLTERFGRVLPFLVGMIFQCVAITLLLEGRDYYGFLAIICLYNLMWNMSMPPLFELMALADGQNRYAVILPTAQALALMIGAIMGGIFVHDFGLSAVLISGIVFTLLALLLFLVIAYWLDRSAKIQSAPT